MEKHHNLYAVMKEVLLQRGGPDVGDVRLPLAGLTEKGSAVAKESVEMIAAAIRELL